MPAPTERFPARLGRPPVNFDVKSSRMPRAYLHIKSVPPGKAPLWVREQRVGLSLPLAQRRASSLSFLTSGVLSGPKSFFRWLAALLAGKFKRAHGAIAILAGSSPAAAAWWNENTPHLVQPKRYFVFPQEVGEVAESRLRSEALPDA